MKHSAALRLMAHLAKNLTIGSYRIVELMGEGGMGAVYEVVHTTLDRRAALKVLHANLGNDPQIAARFIQEAKAASSVQHPGVVQIYEFGQTPEGILFFVMEYLAGETLSGRMRRAADTPANRIGAAGAPLLQQVARALAAVHKQGFVHRDLKPGNVMIVPDPDVNGGERAKVLDFGIAKSVVPPEGKAGAELKTRTGLLMGTPQYMPPEQWRGQKVDGKTDVYALGIIAYEVLVGRVPFLADEMPAMGMQHCFEPPAPLLSIDPNLPAELAILVGRMLEKDPALRPTMTEVADKLGKVLGLPSDSANHPPLRPSAPPSIPPPITPANIPAEIIAEPTAPLQSSSPRQKATPTAPTLSSAKAPARWLMLGLCGVLVAVAGIVALRHDWQDHPVQVAPDLAVPADLSVPAAAPDLALSVDLAPVPDLARPTEPDRVRSRPRCTPRPANESCIVTLMGKPERTALQSALKDSPLPLCPGDKVVIVGMPKKPRFLVPPASVKGETLELFLNTLRGLPSMDAYPLKVEIQCGAK